MRPRRFGLYLSAALIAVLAGGWLAIYLQAPSVDKRGFQALTQATFQDISGESKRLSDWADKVLIVNFWATWCEPCREEIPGLIAFQAGPLAKTAQVVGIAFDTAPNVRDYARDLRINYPILIGSASQLPLLHELGNKVGGLPFTLVLAKNGTVVYRHLGVVTPKMLEAALMSIPVAAFRRS